ncbi:hypothetical protein D3C80_2189010 [compost metagenome]
MRLEGGDSLFFLFSRAEHHLFFFNLALCHERYVKACGHCADQIAMPGQILLNILRVSR